MGSWLHGHGPPDVRSTVSIHFITNPLKGPCFVIHLCLLFEHIQRPFKAHYDNATLTNLIPPSGTLTFTG